MSTHPTPEPTPTVNQARKYKTEAEARVANPLGYWREKRWPEGLYRKLSNGFFFSRFRQPDGSRPFRSLRTDDFAVAKRAIRDEGREVLELRESGQTTDAGDFMTLGACGAEMLRIVERSERSERTRKAYENHVARLRAHWQRGTFDSFPAARVDLDTIMELRDHLKNRAVFVAGRVGPSTKRLRKRRGYSNNLVNQTMWALEVRRANETPSSIITVAK